MHCFGVSHHNPEQVLEFLTKKKVIEARADVLVVASSGDVPATTKRKAVFLLDAQTLTRNLRVLNSPHYDNVMVFVFASPLRIGEIHGCIPLDFEKSQEFGGLATEVIKLSSARLKKGCTRTQLVRKVNEDYLKTMVETVKRGSLLTPLMTFIYTLSSSTHQTPVKEACAKYFRHGSTFEALMRDLHKVGATLTPAAQAKLKAILTTDAAIRYRAFFTKYRPGMDDATLEALCASQYVSAYEVRYILSVVGESGAKPTKAYKKKKRSPSR